MIRLATVDDAAHIAALEAAGAHSPWSESSVRGQLATPSCVGLVCEHGHVLSTVVLDEAEVLTVVVHPEARRRGLGRSLLEALTAQWRRHGVTRAFLEVRDSNAPAIALYEAMGWTQCGRRPGYYATDDGREDARLLELDLG